jgi:hypothetical protein
MRAARATLIPIHPESVVVAPDGTKVVFGPTNLHEVTFTIQDKRARRVEVLGLSGETVVVLARPDAPARVRMPTGHGPPLALRVEAPAGRRRRGGRDGPLGPVATPAVR